MNLHMIERKAYRRLVEWKEESAGRYALLVEGARRVGKTTLVCEFGKNEYRSTVYIDFSLHDSAIREYFNVFSGDLDRLLMYVANRCGVELYERNTLFIFDEVQAFPFARQLIKHLVAHGKYDYIETGSLISIRQNVKDILVPSEEQRLALEPLDFEEFLRACGKGSNVALLRDSMQSRKALPHSLHVELLRLWREYLLVGGMPSVVSTYLHTKQLPPVEREKQSILDLYRTDISRFGNGDMHRVVQVFDQIPAQLSKHEKKFEVGALGSGSRMRDYDRAFFWLEDARLVNQCHNVTDPSVDLRMHRDLRASKFYMADSGLLFTHTFGRGAAASQAKVDVLDGRININEGMLTENAVAQALKARGEDLVYHSRFDRRDSSRRMEIDFMVVRPFNDAAGKMRVTPVEVKSSTRFSTKSLDKFKAIYGKRVGLQVVLSPRELSVDGDRLFLPLYMAHLV